MADTEAAIQELATTVERTRGTVQSAIVFIRGLKDQLEQNADDPEQIRAIAATLGATDQELAAAIATEPTPEPV